jgi:hypothetical protein
MMAWINKHIFFRYPLNQYILKKQSMKKNGFAMNEEIERNNTWDLVDLPIGKTNIGVKWVYNKKFNEKGKVEKHKEILVAKGFSQQDNIDYGETFSPCQRNFRSCSKK